MQDFSNKKILLGVSGGIAAYKSAYLVRELVQLGAEVRVVMTHSAHNFITPMTFQALTGHDVRCALFDSQAERAMGHIELARWADFLIVAPASANCLAKFAQGLADDLLSTLFLVAEMPVILCPAMNRSMWAHPSTQANYQLLTERGAIFVGPEAGEQACGEHGLGRLSEVTAIIDSVRLYGVKGVLQGHHVLITAGPTREMIDPVRFISNRSSGKMGYALARAALMAGARVTLITGPAALPSPHGVSLHTVVSAQDMHDAVMDALQPGMIFIGAAAIADYSLTSCSTEKLKKEGNAELLLKLQLNADIISEVVASKQCVYVVGFAAETSHVLLHAKEKLQKKKLDMIVANQVGDTLGFDQDYHQVTVVTSQQQINLPQAHKISLAGQIIAILATNLQNTAQPNAAKVTI